MNTEDEEPWYEPEIENCKCDDPSWLWDKDRQLYYCDNCGETE